MVFVETQIAQKESTNLKELEPSLTKVVFGQDDAIHKVVDKIVVARAGLKSENKPVGSFLFTGPTGCGKTETAKQLSEHMKMPLVRFDMSEFQERHSVAKFIGAPSSSRVVGWALNSSHNDSSIPAHRVVNRNGLLTGKHHFFGRDLMEQLLQNEGVNVIDNQVQEFETKFWKPE